MEKIYFGTEIMGKISFGMMFFGYILILLHIQFTKAQDDSVHSIENQETLFLVNEQYSGEDPYPNVAEVIEIKHFSGSIDVIRVEYPKGNNRIMTYGAIVATSENIVIGDMIKLEAIGMHNNPLSALMFVRIAERASSK